MDYLLLYTHEEWIVISSTHVLKVFIKVIYVSIKGTIIWMPILYETLFPPQTITPV